MPESLSTTEIRLDVYRATAGLAKGTWIGQNPTMRRFLAFAWQVERKTIDLRNLDVAKVRQSLTITMMRTYLNHLKNNGRKQGGIAHVRLSILCLAQVMADMGYLDYETLACLRQLKTPTVEAGHRCITRLTKAETQRLISEYPATSEIVPVALARNRAAILFMLLSGLRVSEVRYMRWSDLEQRETEIVLRVHGKYSKRRLVKVPARTLCALDHWRTFHPAPEGTNFVFTAIQVHGHQRLATLRPILKNETLEQAVKQSTHLVDVPPVMCHDLRRSFAHNAYLAGASFELIRQALGHTSVTVTEKYIKAPLEFDRAATDIWAEKLDLPVVPTLPLQPVTQTTTALETIESESGWTRQQAAAYLEVSLPQWDRLRKKHDVHPWKTVRGKTKPFDIFQPQQVMMLKDQLTKMQNADERRSNVNRRH